MVQAGRGAHLAQVMAGTEGTALMTQHQHACLGVFGHPVERLLHRVHHAAGQHIERIGTVETNLMHPTVIPGVLHALQVVFLHRVKLSG